MVVTKYEHYDMKISQTLQFASIKKKMSGKKTSIIFFFVYL